MKDYKKILKGVVDIINATEKSDIGFTNICAYIGENCPELKESEDEKMRKLTIHHLDRAYQNCAFDEYKNEIEKCISWLEKQGEQKKDFRERYDKIADSEWFKRNHKDMSVETDDEPQGKTAIEVIHEENIDNTNKVEPRFHEGDFIKHNKANIIRHVISVNSGSYYVENIETGDRIELFNAEQNFHLWTIQDAKDGDILATWGGAFIYNGNNGGGSCPGCYCEINTLGRFKTGTEHHWTGKKVYPATKEQRDTLFAKMKEAGYEYDVEKKVLRKNLD